jgi:ADP-ribose pyrophosphatase YjhB (NUDIX family)/predicted transcriptional regulator
MNSDIKESILCYLIHYPKASFSQVYDNNRNTPSNEFTYYLNKLIEEGLIEKDENKLYSLTVKGKHLEAELDGSTGKKTQRPFVNLLLLAKKDNKYVIYNRQKEPYFGMYGIPGAKLNFGETIEEGSRRELLEETGLTGNGKVITILNVKVFVDNVLQSHFSAYVVLFDKLEGELIQNSIEGVYNFIDKGELKELIKTKKLFPDTLFTIENLEKNTLSSFYEMKITIKDELFTDFEAKAMV